MIFKEITTGKQMILGGINCRTASRVIQLPQEEVVVCLCNFVSSVCDYEELAFAYPEDEGDTYRNDFKSILINLVDSSSTFEFFLVNSKDVETPLVDDTFGIFYDKGFNSLQPLKAGFTIDWLKVYNNVDLGGDIYTIRVKQTDFGNTLTVDSHNIRLMKFSEIASNGTVKIKTIQKGVYLKGEDYEGMSWVNMNRIVAQFGNEIQQNEVTRYKDADYSDYDVQNEFHYQYTMETGLLPSQIADYILNLDMKTDEILISNYDVYAYRQYRDLEVVSEGTTDPSNDYRTNTNKRFTIIFDDKNKNIKRNFI